MSNCSGVRSYLAKLKKCTKESKGVSYEIRLHLLESLVTDRKAELLFCDGEVEP